jgi:hypothetical protein
MGKDVECAHLCDVPLDKDSAKQMYDLIHDEYMVEWYIPVSRCLADSKQDCRRIAPSVVLLLMDSESPRGHKFCDCGQEEEVLWCRLQIGIL